MGALLLWIGFGQAANGQVTLGTASRMTNVSVMSPGGGIVQGPYADPYGIYTTAYSSTAAGPYLSPSGTTGYSSFTAYDGQAMSVTLDQSGSLSVFAYSLTGYTGTLTNVNGGYLNAYLYNQFDLPFSAASSTPFYYDGNGAVSASVNGNPPSYIGDEGATGAITGGTISGGTPSFSAEINGDPRDTENSFSYVGAPAVSGSLAAGSYHLTFTNYSFAQSPFVGGSNTPISLILSGKSSLNVAFTTAPYVIKVVAGNPFTNLYSQAPAGFGTAAQLIGGVAGADRTLNFNSFNGEGSGFASDFVNLSGTGTDKFVLQLHYDLNTALALTGGNLKNMQLAWFNPSTGTWVNAVLGNSDGGAGANEIFGAYDSNSDFHLGDWGIDTAAGTVWAVLDHNSSFVVQAVPEPAAYVALLAGLMFLGRCARNSRSADFRA